MPGDLVVDGAGNLYIADFGNNRVRRVSAATGTISVFAGTGTPGYAGDSGPALLAQLYNPAGLDMDSAGSLYVTEYGNGTVRRITAGGFITTVAGNGSNGYGGDGGAATGAQMNQPTDVEVDGDGTMYIAELSGHRVRKVTPGGTITTLAGTGAAGNSGNGGPAASAQLSSPAGVDIDSTGNLFIAEFGNHDIRKVTPAGTISRVAGTGVAGFSGDAGPALSAQLNTPSRVTLAPGGDFYVSDWGNHRVRYVEELGTPAAPTFSGSTPASPSSANSPRIFGTSSYGNTVRLYTDSACTSAVAGNGNVSSFASPGLSVTVASDSTTTFWAKAMGPGGNESGCSTSSFTYVEDSTVPAAPSIGTAPTTPGNDQTPTWSFTGEAGASFECRIVRGATVVSDWASCSNPKTYDLSAQADGTYTFSVRAVDAAGNTGAAATSNYALDHTPPAAPSIGTAPTSPGNDQTPTWSFTGEAGAAFECRIVRGATVVSDWAACTDPKTYDLSAQADGTYTFSVRATDAVGNTGAAATSVYVLDRTAPAAPSIDTTPPSPDNDASPTWSFSGEAGAAFQCRLMRGATVVSDWATCAGTRSYDLSSEPDGSYTFGVRATDVAGNTGPGATSTYAFDTAGPSAPSIGSSPASPDDDATPEWSFTGEAGAAFECRLERGAVVVSDWAVCTDPESYDLSSEADGSYDFSVRATDVAGNTGAAATSSYLLDRAAPAPPTFDVSPATPGSDESPTWEFSGEAGAAFECLVMRGATVVSGWSACTSPETVDLSGEVDGSYSISVRATDAAGNTGSAASSGYELDRVAPAAPSIDSSPASPRNDATPSWSFSSGEAGAAFECRIARGATVVSDWALCANPKTYNLGLEADGSYDFSVRAIDTAGNTGGASASTYVLDRAAPAAPSIGSGPAALSADDSPAWSFSSEAGATFQCRIMRGATVVGDWAACTDPKTYDLSGEVDGDYDFLVRATDVAGNQGAAATASYELDRTAPAAPSIDLEPATPGNTRSPAWSFSGEAGASFDCRLARGATVVSDWASCSGSRMYDLLLEPDGTYTFSVRATDAVANTGPASTSTYVLDTNAPGAPSIDSAPSTPDDDATPSWSFSSEAGAALECRVERGATVIDDWAACTSPETVDLSAEADGAYTFRVRATDAAGNTGAAASSPYTLDRTAPGAPAIDASPASPDDDESPEWSFSSEAGASFECRLTRGATVIGDWAACADPKSYDLSAQADGTYTFHVRATDVAGNTGAAATSAYDLDRTAPAAPSIDVEPASPGTNRSPAWSFSGEAGASFDCRLARGATVVSDWASCSGSRMYDLLLEPDGTYTFSVRATDVVGNTGGASTSSFVLDTTAPAAPSIGSSPASPDDDPTPSWSFAGEAGAALECRLERGATVVDDWAACAATKGYDLTSEPDGSYDFKVRATDGAGNTGGAASSSYVLDRTAPGAPSIGSSPASPDDDETPAWSFGSEAGATFECRIVRGATVVGDWAACTDPKTYDLSAEVDGDYDFRVRATDVAGNTGPAATSSYRLDRTAPAAPSIDLEPATPGSGRNPAWSFSGEAGAAFDCRLTRGATVVSDWATCSGSRMYDLLLDPDGTYTFAVRATDVVGNTGSASTSSYVLDTTAPAPPAIDALPASPGNDATPEWSFTGEPGAATECRLERGATVVSDWAACSDPKSYDLSSEADGDYDFKVRARDDAGNTGAPAVASYRLDTDAPSAPSIDSAPASPDDDATPEWGFSGEAGAALECRLERGATVVSDWASCADPKGYDLTSEADGDYDFSVRANDAAGNTGPAATSSYTLDRAAPAAPVFGSLPATPASDESPTWQFSGEAGASFECLVMRGATMVSDWASCASPETVALASEPDGTYALSVRATDDAGNTGSAASASYELDRSAPAVPSIDSAPASPGRDATPEWGFSGESGAAFECRLTRGGTVVGDWATCADPKTYDLSSEPDGGYRFAVRARDAAGNAGAAATSDYELDTGAPAAPSIDDAPATPGNDATPAWDFSGEAGAAFECRLERGASVIADWASCSDSEGYDLSSEADGSYDFRVRATDASGNTGPAASSTYVLDTAAPADPTIDTEPTSPSSDRTPAWAFSGDGSALECRLERDAGTVVSDWAGCASPLAYDLDSEPDGDYSFLVRSRDAAGNLSGSDSSLYILDRSVPAVPTIDAGPAPVDNDTAPAWGFSGDSGARSFECRLDRGGAAVSGWAACTDPKSYDLSSEPDGVYDFSVRAINRAGTPSEPATGSYRLDRAAPAAPAIGGPPTSPGRDNNPDWAFSGEAGASFECRLTNGGTTVNDWAACSSPGTFDLSSRPDGTYTFGVRATDVAGNTGPGSTSDYVLDRTAPGAPSIDSAPAPRTASTSPAWAFSGEAGAAFECRLTLAGLTLADWAACASPRGYDVASETDGLFGFSVRARDTAGNTGPAASSSFELDRAGAAVAITGSPGGLGRDRTPTWAFDSEVGATFECRLERDGIAVEDWAVCTDPQTYDLNTKPDGAYTFAVRGQDATGNTGEPITSRYVLDGVAPAPPSIDPVASPSRDRRPGWRFAGEPGAAFECRLEGSGGLVSDWGACVSPRIFDLAGLGDGRYSIAVRATDGAGNTGAAAGSGYDLDTTPPAKPKVTVADGPSGADPTPVFEFTGERGATYECALTRGGEEISARAACASPQAYDISSQPDGEYSMAVRGTDAAGNVSAPGTGVYALDRGEAPDAEPGNGGALPPGIAEPRKPDSEGGPGNGAGLPIPAADPGNSGGTTAAKDEPKPVANPDAGREVGNAIGGDLAKRLAELAKPAAALPNPVKEGSKVVKALGKVAGAAIRNADKTFFPTMLILMVIGFFGLQNRIDRNDPKLGLAPVFADPDLEFGPPPTKP